MTFEVAHQGDTHAVLDDGVVICWLSDDVEPGLADRIARALNTATARTASCFLHGTYDATLTRCPECATSALTRRVEKAEAECGRLREQLAEEKERRQRDFEHANYIAKCAEEDVARLREQLDAARAQADFWERRYKTQHGTVHRLEDEIARLRGLETLEERGSKTG